MASTIRKLLSGIVTVFLIPATSFAVDMLGNPTQIGLPGTFDIQIGGGRMTNLDFDVTKTIATFQVGTASGTYLYQPSTGKVEEDQAFIGLSYVLNSRSLIFVNLGSGKSTSQSSNSRAIGFKLSPQLEESYFKMGLVLRAQQVAIDIDGLFVPPPLNDGTNAYALNTLYGAINGNEQIKYTRLDAFFGASIGTGAIRPYGGVCLSRLSGSDTLSLNETVSVNTSPIGGGTPTTSTQSVSLQAKGDISGSRYFTGVLGLSFNPDNFMGLTTEIQMGVQNTIAIAGNYKF